MILSELSEFFGSTMLAQSLPHRWIKDGDRLDLNHASREIQQREILRSA
jgi:hypothetical protein